MVFIFVDESGGLRPPHPPLSTKNCESDFCQLIFAHERSGTLWSIGTYMGAEYKGRAMQNGTRKAYFNFSLAAFDTSKQQQQAKHGPYT